MEGFSAKSDQWWLENIIGQAVKKEHVWHALVPTAMVQKPSKWEDCRKLLGKVPLKMLEAMYDKCVYCVYCKCNIQNFERIFGVIRVIIQKKLLIIVKPEVSSEYQSLCESIISYHHMCPQCAQNMDCKAGLDVDSETAEHIRKELQKSATQIAKSMTNTTYSGIEIWSMIFDLYYEKHTTILREIGTINMSCNVCRSKFVPECCPKCGYQRYCSKECMSQDEKKHIAYCNILLDFSMVYGRTKVKVLL